jgi:hypothetical protein
MKTIEKLTHLIRYRIICCTPIPLCASFAENELTTKGSRYIRITPSGRISDDFDANFAFLVPVYTKDERFNGGIINTLPIANIIVSDISVQKVSLVPGFYRFTANATGISLTSELVRDETALTLRGICWYVRTLGRWAIRVYPRQDALSHLPSTNQATGYSI